MINAAMRLVASLAILMLVGFPAYGQEVRSSPNEKPGYIEELKALAKLRDEGIITQEDFNKKKAQLLGNEPVQKTSPAPKAKTPDWRRTVVFIFGQTVPGQSLFIRGGIDEAYARQTLRWTCRPGSYDCAIPIRHRVWNNDNTPWKTGDQYLDWMGAESGQQSNSLGEPATGTPLDWTTDRWPSEWGPTKTVLRDGHGEERLNRWGLHYWMLDVDMDCARTLGGWFEFTSYITKGPGGEGEISQPETPYKGTGHFARCGGLSTFKRDRDEPVFIGEIP